MNANLNTDINADNNAVVNTGSTTQSEIPSVSNRNQHIFEEIGFSPLNVVFLKETRIKLIGNQYPTLRRTPCSNTTTTSVE